MSKTPYSSHCVETQHCHGFFWVETSRNCKVVQNRQKISRFRQVRKCPKIKRFLPTCFFSNFADSPNLAVEWCTQAFQQRQGFCEPKEPAAAQPRARQNAPDTTREFHTQVRLKIRVEVRGSTVQNWTEKNGRTSKQLRVFFSPNSVAHWGVLTVGAKPLRSRCKFSAPSVFTAQGHKKRDSGGQNLRFACAKRLLGKFFCVSL